ncbi:hypothetical protein GF325_03210 [Candidatus Bathyarchaeota archaeon]|nr:hypothetical protein [Candidatus Bathyarchaeota archaeon]
MPRNAAVEAAPVTNSNHGISSEDPWDEVGFHRPLAGFWYELAVMIFHVLSGGTVTIILYPLMFPYPESRGYYAAATSLFVVFFTAFDLGTANVINRFIGEVHVKDPKKAILYLQYFSWYQMITGLVQITGIAAWALAFPPGNLAYMTWIWLVFSTTQYPAMTHVFKSAMEAMQQFNKTALITLLEGELLQRSTEVIFVLLFRFFGINSHAFGEILFIAIGLTLGKYLDNFIVMVISAKLFKKNIKGMGIRVRDIFRHDFDASTVKECLAFGFKTGFPGVISGGVSFIVLGMWLNHVPQYTTYVALFELGSSLTNYMRIELKLGGGIAEAYLNGKKALARYYIGQAWRFDGLIQFLLVGIMCVVVMVLQPIFILLGMDNYVYAIPFIIPTIIRNFERPFGNLVAAILAGTDHPNMHLLLSFVKMGLELVSWLILIVILGLPQSKGLPVIAWIMPCGDLAAVLIIDLISYIYIHRKILKLSVPWYQAFIAPAIATGIIIVAGFLYSRFIFTPMVDRFGTVVAILPMALIFLVLNPFFLYLPLTALLGAWDGGSLASFKKATRISGFARFIVGPMYRTLNWTAARARLHDKFSMDDAAALQEAHALMKLKKMRT